MEDYAALLNRVSKQLARSNFTSSKQSKNPSGRRQQNIPVTRIQKTQSGRNSPAGHYNHKVPLNLYGHVTPFNLVQQLPETRDSLSGPNQQAFQLARPHSWHQSALSPSDYSQCFVSSSYSDDSAAWPLMLPWDANSSRGTSSETWSASSTFAGMSQGFSPDGLYAFAEFEQSPGIFNGLADSATQSTIDGQPPLALSHALLASDLPERHLSFDGFYGPKTLPPAELGVPRELFDGPNMLSDPKATDSVRRDPFEPAATKHKANDEELIGLGLYDKAEDTARQNQQLSRQRPTLLFGDIAQPTGKGLKLEETWQPPNDNSHTAVPYESGTPEEIEEAYDDDDDDAGGSSNDGYDYEDVKRGVCFYEQPIATPIDMESFSSFPLSPSQQQFLFGDVTGFANGFMDGHQKALYEQGECGYGWLGQHGQVQFI